MEESLPLLALDGRRLTGHPGSSNGRHLKSL